ncbi:MAG: MFS transporter [Planctomycetes bacterium]|nr:MFS transporter [Planctomycetota bacterium]
MPTGHTPPKPLSPETIQRSLRLSVVEGLAFALMVGFGEVYFLADAIRLSATRMEQGLIVALPLFVGSLGPITSLLFLSKLRSRKPLVVGASLGQGLTLAALGLADYLGASSPMTLLVGACAYNVFGQAVGTAWASWFGDLVPSGVRGTYFGKRNRWIYVVTCLGVFAGGGLLQLVEPANAAEVAGGGGTGFALVLGLAALARFASVALHASTPEPRFRGTSSTSRAAGFLATKRGSAVWRLLGTCALLQFVVYLASPYFSPYMLEELSFSYLEYSIAGVVVVAAKVLFLPTWGAIVDQSGSRAVFMLCALFTALVPLPWLWAEGLGWVLVAQALSGLTWAGYELSLFCLLIESSYRGVRSQIFAMQSVMNGLAQLLGGLGGALLAGMLSDLRILFAISLAGRLLVSLSIPSRIRSISKQPAVRRREVLWRVIGFRPSGGLITRPIPADDSAPESDTPDPSPSPARTAVGSTD